MSTQENNTYDSIEAPAFISDSSSGRAAWDERGNSIWEWQTAPGVYSRDISSQQLQALQAAELAILEAPQGDLGATQYELSARRLSAMCKGSAGAKRDKNRLFESFLKRLGLPS